MAKNTFSSWTFRAKTFASGAFTGVGAAITALVSSVWFIRENRARNVVWRAARRGVVWGGDRPRVREVVWKAGAR